MDGHRSWIALLVAALLPLSAAAACTSPSAPPPAPPFVPAPPGTAQFPGQVIDLANWYLTLPTGKQDQPDEVHQPQLNTFTNPWFHLDDTRNGVARSRGRAGRAVGPLQRVALIRQRGLVEARRGLIGRRVRVVPEG